MDFQSAKIRFLNILRCLFFEYFCRDKYWVCPYFKYKIMRKIIHPIIAAAVLTVITPQLAAQEYVSPYDFGLKEAADSIERYWALFNAHTYAVANGLEVSYEGIDTLEIELPPDFSSIPLGSRTDFGGLVLYVTNHSRHNALFAMSSPSSPVGISKESVDSGDFSQIPELASGDKLLALSDKAPWTERIGYNYHVFRQDLLWIHDGQGMNTPITRWNTDSTKLSATFFNVDSVEKVFRGLTLHRTPESTFRTACLYLNGQYNVLVEDVHVTTPKSKMIADGVFSVNNSAKITFRDVTVDGTYSGYGRWRNWGYAFSLNNLWGARFERVTADGNWGVFGTNSLSNTTLEECDINRFDIHCYGRDALLKRCTLRQRQTQFSSMYGKVVFDSCRFVDCIPVRIRSSYNAYTPFDIEMRDCTFELTMRHHSLVNVMLLDTAANPRPELSAKCWPNLKVSNMTVVVPAMVNTLNLYEPTGKLSELKKPVDYISSVMVEGLKIVRTNGKPAKINVRLSSREFITRQKMAFDIVHP